MVDEELIRAIARDELRKLLAPLLGESQPEMADASTACKILGYPSPRALYEDIGSGLFRIGTEVFDRRRPGAGRARYLFDIKACKNRLKADPNRRRAV